MDDTTSKFSNPPQTSPQSISRRESLRRAAGLLAVGIGAPTMLATTFGGSAAGYRIALYDEEGQRLHKTSLSEEEVEVLMDGRAFDQLKVEWVQGEEEREEHKYLAIYKLEQIESVR